MTKPTKHAGEWATLHAAETPLASYIPRPGTFISRAGQENCTGEAVNNKATALDHGNRLLEFLPQPLKAMKLYGQDLRSCSGCFAFARDRMKVVLWGEASWWLPIPLCGGDKLWTQHGTVTKSCKCCAAPDQPRPLGRMAWALTSSHRAHPAIPLLLTQLLSLN